MGFSEYEVEGIIDYTYHYPEGRESKSTNWFRASVQGCKSKIRSGGMEDDRVEYFEYSCDGTNSTFLIKYLMSSSSSASPRIIGGDVNRAGASRPKLESAVNEAHLILNDGLVPEYTFGLITPVWLAYASRCFYKTSDKENVTPVFFRGRGVRENGIKFKSAWQLSGVSPNLPEWMCDYYDRNRYGVDQGEFVIEALEPPFDREVTNTVYSVITWTNAGGNRLPSSWQVLRYRRNLKSKELEVESETIGSLVSSRDFITVTNFEPDFPSRTRVTDKTVGKLGGKLSKFSYLTDTGKIMNEAELKNNYQFRVASTAAAKEAAVASKSKFRKQVAVVVLATLILGIPLVVLIWRRTHQGNN